MLHVEPKMCRKRHCFPRGVLRSFSRGFNFSGGSDGFPCMSGIQGQGGLRVFVGLNAQDNVLVGTASSLLTHEQT